MWEHWNCRLGIHSNNCCSYNLWAEFLCTKNNYQGPISGFIKFYVPILFSIKKITCSPLTTYFALQYYLKLSYFFLKIFTPSVSFVRHFLTHFTFYFLKCLAIFIYLRVFKRPFRTNTQKRRPFHYSGLECKSRKSRNTWINRKIWLWSMEWSRAKANRVFPRECIGHSKHPVPTTQEKTLHMDIIRWPIPKSDWYYLQPKMEKLYTVSKKQDRGWLWLRSWTPYCQIQT